MTVFRCPCCGRMSGAMTHSKDAARLVARLQLADLAAGREPVESRVVREVEARRAVMRAVTEAVVGAGTEKEVERG